MSTAVRQAEARPVSALSRSWGPTAPFGQHTRYMLRSYVRHTAIVVLAFLAIALTIDLSPRLSRVLADNPDAQGFGAVLHVAWYCLLRSIDILTRLFPITCFLGVTWSEITHTRALERVVVWNSGRSPGQCLAPVLLFALATGALQWSLDCYIRPLAVKTQIDQHLGVYGEQFDRGLSKSLIWMAAGNDLLSARVQYGPPTVMRDLTIYRLGDDGRMHETITADTAEPGSGLNRWLLRGARTWALTQQNTQVSEGSAPAAPDQATAGDGRLEDREIALRIDPLWLANMGLPVKLLPQDTLLALSRPHSDMYAVGPYRAWEHLRYAQAVLPGAMELFGVVLSIFFLAYGARMYALLGLGLAGYAAHLLIKVMMFLGEHQHLSPIIAAWFAPVLLLCASGCLLAAMRRGLFGGTSSRV